MNKIYGYTRGIHVYADDRARDVAKQVTVIKRYTRHLVELYPYLSIGEIYSDVGLGRRFPGIRNLPAGRQLITKMKRSDHLVIGCQCRCFASTCDFVNNMRIWKHQGIIVHLAEKRLKVCMNTPAGILVMKVFQALEDGRVIYGNQYRLSQKRSQKVRRRRRTG